MKLADLDSFKKWFSVHTGQFLSGNETDRKNITLKIDHTLRVCGNARDIAKGLGLSGDGILIAEAAALFHDIGRFTQYAKYGTFKDSISENHGRLGASVLRKNGVLKNLPEKEQEHIIKTVQFHSALALPHIDAPEVLSLLKLIRDADKLDIWRVFVEYYSTSPSERTTAVGQGLPDVPGYTEEVLSCIFQGKIASLSRLKTLNDFKITQLTWVYDLNFPLSFRFLLERDYIKEIISKLPPTDTFQRVSDVLHEYAVQRSQSSISTVPVRTTSR